MTNMLKLILAVLPVTLLPQSGFEIAEMVHNRYMPKDLTNHARMTLTDSKGNSRNQAMVIKSVDKNKKQIIWFLEPRDIRGISFLKINHQDKNDEMRMWLPAFKKVRRISAKKKGDSFMGSDLSYEDLSMRDLNNFNYARLQNDIIQNTECYVIETTPKPKLISSYQKHISWIDKMNFIILREHSYNLNGELEKKKEYSYSLIRDYFIVEKVHVTNVITGHNTEILFSNIQVDTEVDESLFREHSLKRLPSLEQ